MPHARLANIDPAVLALATVVPRRCGFHAPLTPPFRFDSGHEEELVAAFNAFARQHPPVPVGLIQVAVIDSFLALAPTEPGPRLVEFMAECREAFAPFRVPSTLADRKARAQGATTEQPDEPPDRWDEAEVPELSQFLMRLTGPLPAAQIDLFMAPLSESFAGLADDRVELGALSLMRQNDPARRFFVQARRRLTGR